MTHDGNDHWLESFRSATEEQRALDPRLIATAARQAEHRLRWTESLRVAAAWALVAVAIAVSVLVVVGPELESTERRLAQAVVAGGQP